jgi:hypothetical protein
MNDLSHEELEKAAQPLIDILYKYYNPHTKIIVEYDYVEILSGEMAIPIKLRD